MPQKDEIKTYSEKSYYHVYNHSVAELENCFDFTDSKHFFKLLQRCLCEPTKTKNGFIPKNYSDRVQILSYCLMPNHFHFLLYQIDDKAMPELMQSLLTAYSMYFNKKHDRRGSVFESAYKASIIETDAYLLYVTKYIHLNPDSNAMRAASYHNSSLQYYLRPHSKPAWLKPGKILKLFDDKPEEYLYYLKESP